MAAAPPGRHRGGRRRIGDLLRAAAVLVPLGPLPTLAPSGAAFNATSVNPAGSYTADTLQPPTGLGLSSSCPGATVTATWTATSSAYAAGYTLVRKSGGTVQNTISVAGRTTVTQDDTNVPNGTYTYELNSVYQNWISSVASASTTDSCSSNLVTNPGFETGDRTGWSCSFSTMPGVVHSGSWSIRFKSSSGTCSQTVTGLSPSTHYTFAMWTYGTANIGQIKYALPSGSTVTTGQGGTNTWIQQSIGFTTSATDTSVTLTIKCTGGTWSFDDASLT